MRHLIPTLLGALLSVGSARAGATIELVPDRPGPYTGGERVSVGFLLRSDGPDPVLVDSARLDFSASDPRLALDVAFVFDHTANPGQWGIHEAHALPRPASSFIIDVLCACGVAKLYPGESTLLGTLGLDVPTAPGTYTLDAMNAADPDLYHGAFLELSSFPPEFPYAGAPYWRAYTGDLTGGHLDLVVVPEPATLSGAGLLAVWICLRRRPNRCL